MYWFNDISYYVTHGRRVHSISRRMSLTYWASQRPVLTRLGSSQLLSALPSLYTQPFPLYYSTTLYGIHSSLYFLQVLINLCVSDSYSTRFALRPVKEKKEKNGKMFCKLWLITCYESFFLDSFLKPLFMGAQCRRIIGDIIILKLVMNEINQIKDILYQSGNDNHLIFSSS